MDDTALTFFRPCDAIRPYVRYFYVLTAPAGVSALTFPTGCPQIIFHRQAPLYIPELDCRQSPLTVSGQVNFPAHVRSVGPTEMIVAVFRPHTIGAFIGTPPSAFYNREISGYDIDGDLDSLAARIFDSADTARAVSLLEQWLLGRIRPSVNTGRLGAALSVLLASPQTTVNSLAATACLSRKQFERVFREHVGMNPKEYARIARFQRALRMMQSGSRDYPGIAYACGYADQSHFIRDFRQFSGLTPRQLQACATPYSDLYTDPAV